RMHRVVQSGERSGAGGRPLADLRQPASRLRRFAGDYSAPVTSLAALRGYLLEEAIAWLVRTSGYRLLVNVHDDPDGALLLAGHGLLVRGRGANHQADTLGEFVFVPPFSLPIRLFVEAKFRRETTGVDVVRNAFVGLQSIRYGSSSDDPLQLQLDDHGCQVR